MPHKDGYIKSLETVVKRRGNRLLSAEQRIAGLEAEVERLRKENDAINRESEERYEIELRDKQTIERLCGALLVIDSVVPSATPGNSDDYVKYICRKYLGLGNESTDKPKDHNDRDAK